MDGATFADKDTVRTASNLQSITDWLLTGTKDERFIDNVLVELCEKLIEADVPVARAAVYFHMNYPQWRNARILWQPGLTVADIQTFGYGTETTEAYLRSPEHALSEGASEVRQDLLSADGFDRHPIFADLRGDGLTDYVAWPLEHTLGKRHSMCFATDAPGGFDVGHLSILRSMIPLFALLSEVRLKNALARTLLSTYVGERAGQQILAGATTRGSGVTVRAAIMICDIRDFTQLSDMLPRDDVIEMLNCYFEALCSPVEEMGGEILKFMGDGLLAILPLSDENACESLLSAIRQGSSAIQSLNDRLEKSCKPLLRYGVGVHIGDVMYGNIGSRTRLDFTAIGPAVNVASRLEALTKEVGHCTLISRAFVDCANCAGEVQVLGHFPLRGLGDAVEVCALIK